MLPRPHRSIAFWLLAGFVGVAFRPAVAADPFAVTNAPKATPVIDGDVSEWADFGGDVLRMSWAHNQRSGAPDSEPLVVDISYAWDDSNFYTLVQEVTPDDDPSEGFNDVQWCRECNGDDFSDAAPWSTDSIGFYDKGIRWPNGETSPILEVGPYTQWWVGLTTEDELQIGEDVQYRHLVRTINTGGSEGGARLIGPRSEEHSGFDHRYQNLPELDEPQSAFSVIDGKRVVEFFMRWDQIRYDSETDDQATIERIVELLPAIEGHLLQDVKEGYEFRLDPLLVDGLDGSNGYPFGSQTHPSGIEHPDHAQDFSEIAVVRLTGPASPACDFDDNGVCEIADLDKLLYEGQRLQLLDPYDLNNDSLVNLADRDEWYSFATQENGVDLVPGDTNLDGQVAAADLNNLGSNWLRTDATSVMQGDFDGDGNVIAADLNEIGVNWLHGVAAAASAVPEPSALVASLSLIAMIIVLRRRRK